MEENTKILLEVIPGGWKVEASGDALKALASPALYAKFLCEIAHTKLNEDAVDEYFTLVIKTFCDAISEEFGEKVMKKAMRRLLLSQTGIKPKEKSK